MPAARAMSMPSALLSHSAATRNAHWQQRAEQQAACGRCSVPDATFTYVLERSAARCVVAETRRLKRVDAAARIAVAAMRRGRARLGSAMQCVFSSVPATGPPRGDHRIPHVGSINVCVPGASQPNADSARI
jgi:hypothetical protein